MPRDYLPSKDQDLLVWGQNAGPKLTATPLAFGITAPMAVSFNSALDLFSDNLAISSNPSTRTRETIAATLDSKKAFKAEAREVARVINAYPPITNAQRLSLGLTPRKGEASPINPPTISPILKIKKTEGRLMTLQLVSPDSDRRSKPEGVAGASVFAFIGSAPPADMEKWIWFGSTTKTTCEIEFAPTVPAGAQVWLTAFYFSPRSQPGPACTPVSAYIAGGVSGSIAA